MLNSDKEKFYEKNACHTGASQYGEKIHCQQNNYGENQGSRTRED
jgi:hypothetical protein